MAGRSITLLLLLVVVVTAGIGGMMIGDVFFPHEKVIPPKIVPINAGNPRVSVTSTFPFGNSTETITLTVNSSVLEGARSADKSVRVIGNVSDPVWLASSYRAMIDDPAQDELYRDLIGQFRSIRTKRDLDRDEYLELMAVYVQSLRYETIESNPVKYPVEVVADRAGDCDDKSLLLAGLLSREGYSVALLNFVPEEHMAVAVASDEYRYGSSNYTFLETTNLSFIGIPPEKLGSGLPLKSSPVVIPIGAGILRYTSAGQTRFIQETSELARKSANELEPQVRSREEELGRLQQEIQELKVQMQVLRDAGDLQQYNRLVGTHNTRVSDYNIRLETYRELFARYEQSATIYNHIITHKHDRKGVYEYLRANDTG